MSNEYIHEEPLDEEERQLAKELEAGEWVSDPNSVITGSVREAIDESFMLNIKAGIRLKPLSSILAFECCRAGMNRVNLQLFGNQGNEVGKGSIDCFMLERQEHDFEDSPVIAQVSDVTVLTV